MLRPTVRSITNPRILGKRWASYPGGNNQSTAETLTPRPLKKIKLGKARPAIYHQFNCKTELSDGAVVIRRSQYPKDELRMIQDQRNNPLWNPNRDDLVVVDANAGGKMAKFKERYAQFSVEESIKEDIEKKQATEETNESEEKDADTMMMDEYLELLGQNVQEVQSGGKLSSKGNRSRKK